MAPELERLNELGYRLPLNDTEIKRMQNLNRSWSTASGQTTERFRYETANEEGNRKLLFQSAFTMSQFTPKPNVPCVCLLHGYSQQAPVLPAAAANLLGEV